VLPTAFGGSYVVVVTFFLRLEEIAVRFATNYYAISSAGPTRLEDLAPLYTQQSIMAHEGETCRGEAKILEKLRGIFQMNSTFGKVSFLVDHIDTQALGKVCVFHMSFRFLVFVIH
jgi:hypothetical protein